MKVNKLPTWVIIAYLVFCLFSGLVGWILLGVSLSLFLITFLIGKLLAKRKKA